jgi:HlyD family secretion protein
VSRARVWAVVALVGTTIFVIWGFSRRTAPPEVNFVKVTRETIVSSLSTNGKVEPIEWASARAERAGVVEKVYVQRGQEIGRDAPLVTLDIRDATSALAAANSDIAQAQAQREVLRGGGRLQERTDIQNQLASARLTLQNAQRDLATLERLVGKQAATRQELDAARQKVEQTQLQIRSLEQRKSALVAPTDKSVADARLEAAQSSATLARRNLGLAIIRAPLAGTVYQFDLRRGSFVNPGDLVANVGRLDKVRVIVYVDEPDLGRIEKGVPVTITWDAAPGRQWKGVVDKLPTQVVPLGTRQVGEVSCVIDNPDRDLPPGANINAEIQSRVVQNAVTVPKVALRRDADVNFVFLLNGERIVMRNVTLGVSSYTKAQVLKGLADGDSVALPSEKPLKDGLKVQPLYPQ